MTPLRPPCALTMSPSPIRTPARRVFMTSPLQRRARGDRRRYRRHGQRQIHACQPHSPLLRRVAGQRAARRADVRSYTRASLCDKVGVVQQKAVLFQGQHKGKTSNGAMKTQMTPRCGRRLPPRRPRRSSRGSPAGSTLSLSRTAGTSPAGRSSAVHCPRAREEAGDTHSRRQLQRAGLLPPTPRCAGRYTASQAA